MPRTYRAAIVTVSDSVASGTREDVSGPTVARILESAGWEVHSAEIVPDDFSLLRERLSALGSDTELDAVFTTGGTGIGPRDRTPEATTSVMERSVPGLAELMRRAGVEKTPLAALSRAVVGVKGKVLLVNLPGSPAGAEDSLRAILEVLPHAVAVVRGEEVHAPAPGTPAPAEAAGSEAPGALPPSEPASVPETAPSPEPPSGE
ncbi:MAG TPA: MogA/MoaB family molybdenum cofactor biosynthesis protein [Candidatus Xenobia bacterium]|nr:MogA/MoaB family molybdenum cofactor biosynthesis protein [Candidatus Xenobia bacterium]